MMRRPAELLCICAAILCTGGVSSQQAPVPIPGTSPTNGLPGTPVAPEWAYPDSAVHKQVAPPPDFHRLPRIIDKPIGIFDGQADVGSALVPGNATYAGGTYTITSAGYNLWYTRDEFRYLWKRMSGSVSLAADIAFPNPNGYGDRKAVLVIRQSLDDDAKEVVAGLHGAGMIQLAERPAKGQRVRDIEYRIGSRGALPGGASPDSLVTLHVRRIGLQKRGDEFTLWVSEWGEPMHQLSAPMRLHLNGPFYVGIGFVSHLPTTADTARLSNVFLRNAAGRMQ